MTMKIINRIFNKIPERTFSDEKGTGKVISWFNKNVSSPENRLILGVTALASQPFMDLYNKEVDEKTRVVSCARTIAKILSGTLTGVLIRAAFIGLTKNLSAVGKLGSKAVINVGRAGQEGLKEVTVTKARQFFTPSTATSHETHAYKQYQNAMGTALAIVTMVFTNFIIDAPLTKFLTNRINKKFEVNNVDSEKNKGGIK